MPDANPTRDNLLELARLARATADSAPPLVERAAGLVLESLEAGGRVLACGNGGSAAAAQHLVSELVGRFYLNREAMDAVALSADPSILTSMANDYGFEAVFSRQVEGLGRAGDVLVAFSTSGSSPNVLAALRTARARGMRCVAFVGEALNPDLEACDVVFTVASRDTPRIQEIHDALLHALCQSVERRRYPEA